MNRSELTQKIKGMALAGGASVVGIASVDDIDRLAPEGYRPDDLLPNAKSVVVMGGKIVTSGAWRSPFTRITGLNQVFGRVRRSICIRLVTFLEDEVGAEAIYYDGSLRAGLTPFLSLKLCAEMAGLGTRSLAGGAIVNAEHGALNFACVITNLELDVSGPLEEPVCPHPSCAADWERNGSTPCLRACPLCLSGELCNGAIKTMRYERYRCVARNHIAGRPALEKLLLEAINEPSEDRRRAILTGDFFSRVGNAIASGDELVGNCYDCLRGCPYNIRPRRKNISTDP